MTEHEMLRLNQALTTLADVYKEPWTNESLKTIYCKVLDRVSLDAVLQACDTWLLSDSPFFPKPGQLYRLAMNHLAEDRLYRQQIDAYKAKERQLSEARAWTIGTPEHNLANVRALIESIWPGDLLKQSPGEIAAEKASARARFDIMQQETE